MYYSNLHFHLFSTSEVYLRYNAFQNERNLRKEGLRDNVNCVYQDLIKFNR